MREDLILCNKLSLWLKKKEYSNWNIFISINFSWCSIKDDYRTLVDLKVVNVVNMYAESDESEDDE